MTTKAQALLEHGLKDIYDAEQRFVQALDVMRENAHDRSLANGFKRHRDVTREQVKRLEKVFKEIGSSPEREECPAARGLVREYEKFVDEQGAGDGLLDAFAASASLKVEHYEIASYRALIDLAQFCDHGGAVRLLKQTLMEEEQAAAEMQSAATKLSAELAGASTVEVAQRSVGSMVDQVREGTLTAMGGVRSVGERAIGRAKRAVGKAEERGRERVGQTTTSARPKAKSATSTVKRKAKKATASRPRGTSKGTKGTRNVSRARAKSTATRSRSSAARKSTRPAARKTTSGSRRRTTTSRRTSR